MELNGAWSVELNALYLYIFHTTQVKVCGVEYFEEVVPNNLLSDWRKLFKKTRTLLCGVVSCEYCKMWWGR